MQDREPSSVAPFDWTPPPLSSPPSHTCTRGRTHTQLGVPATDAVNLSETQNKLLALEVRYSRTRSALTPAAIHNPVPPAPNAPQEKYLIPFLQRPVEFRQSNNRPGGVERHESVYCSLYRGDEPAEEEQELGRVGRDGRYVVERESVHACVCVVLQRHSIFVVKGERLNNTVFTTIQFHCERAHRRPLRSGREHQHERQTERGAAQQQQPMRKGSDADGNRGVECYST